MEKKTKMLAAIQVLAALVIMGAMRFWAPVCQKMLTLENGKEVHMKCFYTDRVGMILAALVILVAIIMILSKRPHKAFYVINLALGAFIFLSFTSIIGVCMNPEMSCNTTKIWAYVTSVIIMMASLIGIFSGRDGQIPS